MSAQKTPRKISFLEHFARCGDVGTAAALAGYRGANGCYRFLRTDDAGRYVDPVTRSILEAPGEPRPKTKTPKVVNLEVVQVDPLDGLTIDDVQRMLMGIARDPTQPSGVRVQALHTLLKDLREQELPPELSPEAVIVQVKIRLGLARLDETA